MGEALPDEGIDRVRSCRRREGGQRERQSEHEQAQRREEDRPQQLGALAQPVDLALNLAETQWHPKNAATDVVFTAGNPFSAVESVVANVGTTTAVPVFINIGFDYGSTTI